MTLQLMSMDRPPQDIKSDGRNSTWLQLMSMDRPSQDIKSDGSKFNMTVHWSPWVDHHKTSNLMGAILYDSAIDVHGSTITKHQILWEKFNLTVQLMSCDGRSPVKRDVDQRHPPIWFPWIDHNKIWWGASFTWQCNLSPYVHFHFLCLALFNKFIIGPTKVYQRPSSRSFGCMLG